MNRGYSRRKFLFDISIASGAGIIGLHCGSGAGNEKQTKTNMEAQQQGKKLGIALVGLGGYSSGQLGPALKETQHCYLAGIVTGTPKKADEWKSKYAIPNGNIYNYSNFEKIKDNPDIDIVYVVLPNAMHAEYVIRAAEAGKHVICEKPMATTVEDCDRMIAACRKAGKMLSIGYRLHFEPHHREVMRLGREKPFGEIKNIIADHGMSDTEGWRLDRELAGGGPLMDVGIYCVQAARYATGLEPIAVTAQRGPQTKEKFSEIEESLTWKLEFPGGITAACKASYSQELNQLRVNAATGWYELAPSFPYEGVKGNTSNGEMKFETVNQQALQMDDFAQAILQGRPTPVPGEMGRQDVKILLAIYQAMETGTRVEIGG